jgi:hypothetical protein
MDLTVAIRFRTSPLSACTPGARTRLGSVFGLRTSALPRSAGHYAARLGGISQRPVGVPSDDLAGTKQSRGVPAVASRSIAYVAHVSPNWVDEFVRSVLEKETTE